jgi:hypothetical protein
MRRSPLIRWSRPALFAAATLAVLLSCDENLPSGPDTFAVRLEIGSASDTLVVGDSSKVQARAIGPNGGLITNLTFAWTSSNTTALGLAASDAANGQTRTLVAIKPGVSVVTLALPDERFTTTNATRNATVVVGGVKVLSSHDSTLTSINDTATAIATSLVKNNGALVNRASQGIRWIHQGTRTLVIGAGDTIRYVSKSNGADTLIATNDLCLKSAKCADTVIARVAQVLTMTVSTHTFQVWSFSDSVGPTVTVADRRGNGLAGTSVRFIPLTLADSAIVKVTPPIGTSNPTTGLVAAPRLVSIGNGTARVIVRAIAPDGSTIIATDTLTETVRQVARRIIVEPQRAIVSVIDSIPYVSLARDARGAVIADATTGVVATGTVIGTGQIGPNLSTTPSSLATLTPTISGVATPDNNPQAPQVPVIILSSVVNLIAPDTVLAGQTGRQLSVQLLDSTGALAVGVAVRFSVNKGTAPATVFSDGTGVASVAWFAKDSTGSYTLTGVRDVTGTSPLDSIGTVVIKRSVVVVAGLPDPVKTIVAAGATSIAVNTTTTITVAVRDAFSNPVLSVLPSDLTMAATAGVLSAGACSNTTGLCTFTYTAPAAAGPATITAKIGIFNVTGSPIAMTITP